MLAGRLLNIFVIILLLGIVIIINNISVLAFDVLSYILIKISVAVYQSIQADLDAIIHNAGHDPNRRWIPGHGVDTDIPASPNTTRLQLPVNQRPVQRRQPASVQKTKTGCTRHKHDDWKTCSNDSDATVVSPISELADRTICYRPMPIVR